MSFRSEVFLFDKRLETANVQRIEIDMRPTEVDIWRWPGAMDVEIMDMARSWRKAGFGYSRLGLAALLLCAPLAARAADLSGTWWIKDRSEIAKIDHRTLPFTPLGAAEFKQNQADIAAGKEVATKCQACHNLDQGGPNQTGPNLWGVIGRKPGTHAGFSYSAAMVDFGGKIGVWDYNHIYMFIAGPQAYLSGTKMGFVGLKQPQDRVNLIAWLRQQSSSPVAIPAPNPAAAAPAPTAAAAVGSTPANNGAASTPAVDATKTTTGVAPTESPAAAPKPAAT